MAAQAWGISFPVKGDPWHSCANLAIRENMIGDLFIEDYRQKKMSPFERDMSEAACAYFANHPLMKTYTVAGCVQPGIALVWQDRSVAYSMAVQPSILNGGGAADRPDFDQVWAAFKQLEEGGKIKGSKFRKAKLSDEAMGRTLRQNLLSVVGALSLWGLGIIPPKILCAFLASLGALNYYNLDNTYDIFAGKVASKL